MSVDAGILGIGIDGNIGRRSQKRAVAEPWRKRILRRRGRRRIEAS